MNGLREGKREKRKKNPFMSWKLKACLMLTLIPSVAHLINGIAATLSLSAASWIRALNQRLGLVT